MRQYIIDFIHGFTESFAHNVGSIERYRAKIFLITIAITMVGTGIFLVIWGISSYIDSIFAMKGIGFVLVGMIVTLVGIINIYKRYI